MSAVATPKRKPKRRKLPAANPWPERLKALRAAVGERMGRKKKVTQAEAAELIRASERSWLSWEKGEEVPSPPFALLIEMLEAGKI
jgi:DNA-binding transcriptional regulator YiaG